jgi:hypothetical protein
MHRAAPAIAMLAYAPAPPARRGGGGVVDGGGGGAAVASSGANLIQGGWTIAKVAWAHA